MWEEANSIEDQLYKADFEPVVFDDPKSGMTPDEISGALHKWAIILGNGEEAQRRIEDPGVTTTDKDQDTVSEAAKKVLGETTRVKAQIEIQIEKS